MTIKRFLSLFSILFIFQLHSQAQRVHFIGDLQLLGIGSVSQSVTSGSNTERGSVTGLSGFGAGANIDLPYNFEVNVLGGFFFNILLNANYSSSGKSSSNSSQSLAMPRTGMEFTYNLIIEKKSFVSGISFGAGFDMLWAGRFNKSDENGSIRVSYDGAVSPFYRIKLIFKPLGKFTIQPYLSYRTFEMRANDYNITGDYTAPDESLINLKGRNLEFGAVVIIGAKN
ncbi:hypothetical protein [Reichenbachiella ulvae]|uniref:Outer membrane protein beta-barrel domain-containing protein n=1 Tax=Reichenbachiella ulvae TaxID=2980104 RepID=A0ABT3CWX5_9BACT|nr:hypothetical protein [Reichenbachiella ulvae]MCV9388102.1 hypothetical protein [Reichenbachiella ulvae]